MDGIRHFPHCVKFATVSDWWWLSSVIDVYYYYICMVYIHVIFQAMAKAVEDSFAVIIAMSQKYKDSPNTRAGKQQFQYIMLILSCS